MNRAELCRQRAERGATARLGAEGHSRIADERSAALLSENQSLVTKLAERALNSHELHAKFLGELASGWELVPGPYSRSGPTIFSRNSAAISLAVGVCFGASGLWSMASRVTGPRSISDPSAYLLDSQIDLGQSEVTTAWRARKGFTGCVRKCLTCTNSQRAGTLQSR